MPRTQSMQAPAAVVMIRPHCFTPNHETASDNSFQAPAPPASDGSIAIQAHREVTDAVECLQQEGIRVHLFEDMGRRQTPDSVFPNNWFSTHAGGQVAIYPMYSPSRRRERRHDVIEMLKAHYRVHEVTDYSGLEEDGLSLEGTGAMVLDHQERVAYTARSNRADDAALERFCARFNFEPMIFDTAGRGGHPVYHTNVLMCVATEYALVGFDSMTSPRRAAEVRARLSETGREIVALDNDQIAEFCGNAIELTGHDGRILALSSRALNALTSTQKAVISRTARLVPLSVPTIELAGGSVRCMLAGIHLAPRNVPVGAPPIMQSI